MYVVWKKRELRGTRACTCCGSTAHGRIALIPLIVASERINGAPRQVHFARLASIRSCCLHSKTALAAWWPQVEATLDSLADAEAAKIRRLLSEALAKMKKEGVRGPRQQKKSAQGNSHVPGYLAHPLRVLGLSWPCRADQVKSAFRIRAKQTHPDVGGRAEDFRAVADAYSQVMQAIAL